jgi:hypothetical protein
MAFQPVPRTAKFAVVHALPTGDELVNVFYFVRVGDWGIPELAQACTALAQAWINDVMIHLSVATRFIRIESRGERAQDDVSFEFVVPSPVPGGRSGEPSPPQIAFCVTHLTGFAGRSNRGRTYFGVLAREDVVGGFILVARANGLRDGLASVRNIMSTVGWTHVVVSRVRNRVRLQEAITTEVIGYKYTDTVVDTQRRRQVGRGS